jgi:hypothetical protein
METQILLFEQIKQNHSSHFSLVDEISELLSISNDSAYRRIRGEKALSLNEIQKISNHFNISLDTLFGLKSDNVVFKSIPIGPDGYSIKDWLKAILFDMQRIYAAKEKEIIYSAKDPPLFHYFHLPEIAQFKVFFWQKTLLQFPDYTGKKFSLHDFDEEVQQLGMQALAKYVKVPTIELWNEDTFIIVFSQIEYYWLSGYFENKEDIFTLCEKFSIWIQHIKEQAELGFKFIYGAEPIGIEDSFKLFVNEVVLNDNSILVRMDDVKSTYVTNNVLSLLISTHPEFCQQKENFLRGLCKKSSLISQANSKERNIFFNRLLKRVDDFKSSIS